jgi:hypothetical protein
MKTLIFILVAAGVDIKLPAQITIAPTLEIQLSLTNVATLTANIGNRHFPNAVLEMSTNLAETNWINLQTNIYVGAGPIVFENVPATNMIEFFRLFEY